MTNPRDILAREKALTDGWRAHAAGKPVTACLNATEREGWQDRARRATRAAEASSREYRLDSVGAGRTPQP